MHTFRLAHLSDPHLAPPPIPMRWRDVLSKRVLSRLAWRRKRLEHQSGILAAMVADVKAQAPDHILLTGDLTNFSMPEEFAAADAWLEALAPVDRLTVSPGNHDALAGVGGHRQFANWDAWMGDRPGPDFPKVRLRGPVAIVNLCSATPTAPLLAQGKLGREQVARLGPILRTLGEQGFYRVVMLHHPPTRRIVSGRKALVDGDALRRTLAEEGAELVLHGHAHEAATSTTPGPDGPIPVLGVPSASAAGRIGHPAARWHGFEVERHDSGFTTRVTVRGLGAGGRMENLGRYVLV